MQVGVWLDLVSAATNGTTAQLFPQGKRNVCACVTASRNEIWTSQGFGSTLLREQKWCWRSQRLNHGHTSSQHSAGLQAALPQLGVHSSGARTVPPSLPSP